jgi:hypothetical protein
MFIRSLGHAQQNSQWRWGSCVPAGREHTVSCRLAPKQRGDSGTSDSGRATMILLISAWNEGAYHHTQLWLKWGSCKLFVSHITRTTGVSHRHTSPIKVLIKISIKLYMDSLEAEVATFKACTKKRELGSLCTRALTYSCPPLSMVLFSFV